MNQKTMRRLRKKRYRSPLKSDLARSKQKCAKSKVRGFLDGLQPAGEVFPFFNFQPELELFTHNSSHPSELDINKFLARDSLEIPDDLFIFPTYSQDEWIWLGEDGYDVPPLEPIFGATPSNPIDFDQFTSVQELVYFDSSNAFTDRDIEKRDYYKNKVRFANKGSRQTKRKTEPDKYSIYEVYNRKKANIFRESSLESSSLVSTQSLPSVVNHPSKIRDNFVQKRERSKGSDHIDVMKEPSKNTSIEVRFNNAADILAFASTISKEESKSTASNHVTSSRSSGQVKQAFSTQNNRESSSTDAESPIADSVTRQEGCMMENLVTSPKSPASNNSSIDSEETEIYFFESHPDSSEEGEIRKNDDSRSGVLSEAKSEVIEHQPRRSARIRLRQCRGKQDDLIEPLFGRRPNGG